jgi:hypothetical protein
MVGAGQSLGNERLIISPSWTDGSGNRFIRLIGPSGQLSLAYEADVESLVSRDRPETVVVVAETEQVEVIARERHTVDTRSRCYGTTCRPGAAPGCLCTN